MTHAAKEFEFVVTFRRHDNPAQVFTVSVTAREEAQAKKKAIARAERYAPNATPINVHCDVPRWRREIGHAIVFEREVTLGHGGYVGLEVETNYALVFVYGDEAIASISKTKREAMFWGAFVGQKYGRRRGVSIMWLAEREHLTGRKGPVKPNAKSTRQVCGAEIYRHAVTGEIFGEEAERKVG